MPDADATPDQIPASSPLEPTGVYSPLDSASELASVLDQYLADLQAGKTPDKAQLLAEHADLAHELENCLAGIEFVHRAAKPAAATPTQLGDFRIIREVGRGGMGVVYEAEQQSLKRKVALKVLRFGVTADPEVMQRFQREAETVAHLHHTNIVPIHAVGCEQGVHYYAMQFIEGRSLAAVVDEAQQAPSASGLSPERFREIVGWTQQAAEALAHAHQRGVIHRDIKPSNLILDPEGTVWLTDFGLAKRADEVTLTAAGMLMGTPRYMSPEQAAAAKQPIDHRTDIYSLGATLYELATGKPVFDSQTPQGVITQILNVEPVAPRLLQGQLPRDLETIILKCLAKEPAGRYQQARDLADDLRAFLENRSIRARRASLAERAARWAKKHRRSTAVSAATAALSLLVIVGGFFGWNAYQESLKGRLSLTTEGPALVAEVLDDRDELVIPSFPVPTPQPVVLPAGSYHVRLSGSGQLSETWQIEIERGRHHTHAVKLLDRQLGKPLEVFSRDPPALFELDGQTHLLVGGERGWRVLNGATSGSLWPGDLKLPDAPIPPTDPNTLVNREEWRNMLEGYSEMGGYHSPATGQSPGLALPTVDLDADGRQDLVFASRVSPSLLAISAKDGRVLWWFRAAPNLPQEHDFVADPLDLQFPGENGGVVGQPILVDIDGSPVVVAVFASINSNLRTQAGKMLAVAQAFRIEAVSALTGQSLWRVPFNPTGLPPYYGESIKLFPTKPEIVPLEGRLAVLLQVQSTLFAFDVRTGKDLWTYDLGLRPVEAPHIGDLDGDGQPEALFVFRRAKDSDELVLRAISLKSRDTLWEHPFLRPGYLNQDEWRPPGTELATVADLDGDGKPEVVIPVRDDWGKYGKHWFGVEALNGTTGNPLWQRRLWSMGFSQSSGSGGGTLVRLIVGPDLDGDRRPELFVASLGSIFQPPQPDIHYLQVDALSGKTGEVLWRRRQKGAGDSKPFEQASPLRWWHADNEGWPQLVVPVNGAGGQPITYIMAAATGRVKHILPEVSDPQVADFDSDGIPDLFHLAGSQGSRRLAVFKGVPPVDWRRSGDRQPADDYDGDGIPDFLEWRSDVSSDTRLVAFSGATDRILWESTLQPDSNSSPQQRQTNVDVNGDEVADVVVLEHLTTNSGGRSAVSAISGKDGSRLWTAADFGLQSGSTSSSGGGPQMEYSYPMLDQCDLDGDGRPEILVAAHIDDANGIKLAALSSDDGHLLWKIPIEKGAYTGRSLIDQHIWHDIDGDGVLDTALWGPKSINEHGVGIGVEFRAFSGRDGKSLWTEPAKLAHEWFWWPRPAISDLDGDGIAEVVVTTQDYQSQKAEMAVLDGRNGKQKWNWAGTFSGSSNFWPPLPVAMDVDGQRMICLGIQEQSPTGPPFNANNIVVFDPQGTIRARIPVSSIGNASAWTALDADGDGKEELLYVNEAQLQAYRGSEQRDLWKWPRGSWGFRLDALRPGPKGQPGTLVAWADRTVNGLNVATGEARWRCDVPRSDNYQLVASLDHRQNSDDAPLVVSYDSQSKSTMAQRAWPTNARGVYQAPGKSPLDFSEFVDPDRFRPLPWGRWHGRKGLRVGQAEALTFLVFVGTLMYWATQGKWRRAGVYLLFAGVVSFTIGALLLRFAAAPLEAGELYSWEGWYWIVFIGSGALGALTIVAAVGLWLFKRLRRLVLRHQNQG
ncbi:MAG: protein kinase domain-containing protein [Planctomycetales bacterium]